jgi:hypothetical protein
MGLVDCDKEPVEVGLSKTALLDFEDASPFKFLEVGTDAALTCPEVLGESSLVGPSVFEQHGVGELCSDRQLLLREDDVGDHGEPVQRHRIGSDDFDIARDLRDATSDLFHMPIVHHAVTRESSVVENGRIDYPCSPVRGVCSPSSDVNGDLRNLPAFNMNSANV